MQNIIPPLIFHRNMLRLLQLVLVMLCINVTARAVTVIPVSGDTSVCSGEIIPYTISPTAGLTYKWNSFSNGYIYSATAGTGNVLWGAPGTGTVEVFGINTSGDTIEHGTRNVNVYKAPATYLTASALVACQQLATTDTNGQPRPPGMLPSSGCINTCENSVVTYYAHDLPGSTFTWIVSGASSYVDMGDSCVVTWGGPGSGAITATTTNSHGCTSTITICIKVIEGPDAIFTTLADSTYNTNSTDDTVRICAGGTVQFRDISTSTSGSPLVSCVWDFGDGKSKTTSGPTSFSHKYTTAGTYVARLLIRNSCGCTDSARVTVVVGPCNGVSISCPSVVCEGATAKYTINPVVGCFPYNWSVKGGTITTPPMYPNNIFVKWDKVDTSGFGYVIFDGAGCTPPYTGKTVVKVPVILAIGHISGPQVICPSSQYIYRMPEWPSTEFNWAIVSSTGSFLSYTGQRNEAVINTGSAVGTIILKVTYKNTITGCGGYAMDTIKIQPPVAIIGPTKYCLNDNGNWHLTGGAPGDWLLVYPDGLPLSMPGTPVFVAPLNQVGTYTLSVSGIACGPAPIKFTVEQRPGVPTQLISAIDSPCANVPYKFIGGGIGEGSTFGWAVSSGKVAPATGDSAIITFSGPGPYTVKLWRISGVAPYCTSDTFRVVYDNPHPNPVITGPAIVCGSSQTAYDVSYKKGETYSYEIIPAGAGSISSGGTGPNPTVTWNNPGVTSAILRVHVRKCGTSVSADYNVTINGTPPITLTPSSDTVCSGQPVTFTISSTPPLGTWGTVTWDFGDGHTATGTSLTITHAYENPATSKTNFAPSVTVQDLNGCPGSIARAATNVWIRPLSVALITPAGPITRCGTGWLLGLSASISSGPAGTAFFAWYKNGSGPVLSGPSASVLPLAQGTPLSYGTYYCLVTNTDGCVDTTNVVEVDSNCTGGGGCVGRSVSFTTSVVDCGRVRINASVTGGSIIGFEWESPAGAYDIDDSNPTYMEASFHTAGMYKFKYRIQFKTSPTDSCWLEFDTTAIVPYVGGMNYSIVCTPSGTYDVTIFDNSTYYPGVAPLTYDYRLQHLSGGTYTSTGGGSFKVPGLMFGTVFLYHKVSKPGFPPCEMFDTLVLPTPPLMNIFNHGFNPACEKDGLVRLEAGSSDPSLIFHWDFDDGTDNNMNPVDKKFNTPKLGGYNVILTGTNLYGCKYTRTYNINVQLDNLTGNVSHTPLFPCEGAPVTLQYNNLTGTATTYKWYDQTTLLTGSAMTKQVFTPGAYWAFVTDSKGCELATAADTVHFVEVPDGKISGSHDQCINVSYTLDGGAPVDVLGGIHHEWLRDGGVISTFGNSITELFGSPGVHVYKLITVVPNPGGGQCRDTSDAFTVTIHGATGAPLAGFSILDCKDYTVQLTASSPYAGTFNWSHGATGPTAIAYTGGPYKVYLTDIYGCPSSTEIFVPRSPQEYLWVFPVGCYTLCAEGMPYKLLGPSGTFYRYDWMKGGASVAGGSGAVPPYNITSPGTYNLSLANAYCTDTSESMDVSIIPCPPVCTNNVIFNPMSVMHITLPDCRDSINIMLGYTGAPPGLPYTISAKHGIIVPGAGTLPTPPMPGRYRYIADPGYTGMFDTLILRVTMPDGSICLQTRVVAFTFTPCANALAKMVKDGEEQTLVSSETAKLLLAPNPARNTVRIDYMFTGESTQRFVEIFDMTGKLMKRVQVATADGSISVELDQLSAGMYQVIMRQDNDVVLHSKLAVIH